MSNTGLFTPEDINELTAYGQWQGLSQRGTLELIQTQSYSFGVSAVDFTSIKESEYNVHFMTFSNMQSDTDNKEVMQIQLYESGVLETGSVYNYARQNCSDGGGFNESKSTSDDDWPLMGGSGDQTNERQYGYLYLYDLGNSAKYSYCTWMSGMWSSDPYFYNSFGSGVLPQASIVDGIRVKTNGGNFASFDISLYGIRYS